MSRETNSIFDTHPDYEATIGIEIHVQLKTNSKMFCSCQNRFGDSPNSNICHVCAGHPGTLPVLNRKSVDFGIMAGLATNCSIAKISTFARKHYMYPDLPKNFQITQDKKPLCENGFVPIDLEDGSEKKIRLIRIHMEEDAGKNIHSENGESFVDLNRAGTPLLEIVSEPDISNAYEARVYLMRVRAIVQYLGISDANMEQGSFRADTNISVKKKSAKELGTRVELKNINSFKFIGQAINYEIKRQIELVKDGGRVVQETRLWNTKNNQSVAMRSKEEADDYRYFNEPDIPPLLINDEWIEKMRNKLPELPHHKFHRFKKEYELTAGEAEVIVDNKIMAEFFEKSVLLCNKPKQVSNWMLRNLLQYLKENKMSLSECLVTPETLAELIAVIDQGIINTKVAQDIFLNMIRTGKYPSIIIQEEGLQQISSSEELVDTIRGIIEANPNEVARYKAGNERLFAFFIGQAMKETKGKGNPQVIQELLKKYLK